MRFPQGCSNTSNANAHIQHHRCCRYEPVPAPRIVWIFYMSAVCGCIASVALKGIFKVSVNTVTGITSRISILTVTPAADVLGANDFNAGQLLAVIVCLGLGTFFAGVMLTSRAIDGSMSLIKIDYPTVASWRWRHQLLVTVSVCCLAVSNAIVQSEAASIPAYVSGLLTKSPAFVLSVLLLAFACSMLSTLLTLHEVT